MKKMFLVFIAVLLLLFCVACGSKDTEQTEDFTAPEGSTTPNIPDMTEQTTPTNPPESENDTIPSPPQKIHLDGQAISYDRFPIPDAEAFALTGEDASLYQAAVSHFNREAEPGYFASDSVNTDLILPSVSVFGSYTTDEGNTAYVVNFVKCFFYDLGSGLGDLDNPVYTSYNMNNLASFTLDKDGNLVAFDELGDGEEDSAVYQICGPLTDIAEKYLSPGGGWPEEIARVPNANSYEDMLQQYLNFYFEG